MSDLRLKNIEIRNWMTVKSARIDFPKKGLILVLGSNKAADGRLKSVGAGKTALGEALSRTLLGVEGRFTHLGYYLSDTEKENMYVKVEADLVKEPFVVEMGFKCPEMVGEGETLRFRHGNREPFQAARATQTRAQLEKTLQVTPKLASWTAFVDGDRLKFNRLSQEDSVNLLMTSLAQPPWTEYLALAAKKLQTAKQNVDQSEKELKRAKEKVEDDKESLEEARDDYNAAKNDFDRQTQELDQRIAGIKRSLEADRKKAKEGQKRLEEIKKELKLIEEERAKQNHEWDIERQNLKDDLALTEEDWQKSVKRRASDESQLESAEDALEEMNKVPKECPRCGKPWDKAHSEKAIAEAKAKIIKLTETFQKSDVDYQERLRIRNSINSKIQQLDKKLREKGETQRTQDLGDEYDDLERDVRNANAMAQQRELSLVRLEKGIDPSFMNKKHTVLEEREAQVKKSEKEVTRIAGELADNQDVLKVVQYWHKAFGPSGIPNMILSEAVPLLNRVAQRISGRMTGGTLEIRYSTTRELVSGESRAQLVTKVINKIGSKRLEGSSKGEGGLTNLIIAENINEVGNVSSRIGYRWYDEVTSGQDSVVRRNIFSYLKEIANQQGILIFVVDHDAVAANYADYVLVAEKSAKEGTTYYWG